MTKTQANMEKLIALIRNKVSDPAGRGTDITETSLTINSNDEYILAKKGLKNIYWVENSDTGERYTEFIDFNKVFDNPQDKKDKPKIKWLNTSTPTLDVRYHYGKTFIYPGFPHDNFTSPRISISQLDTVGTKAGIGDRLTPSQKGFLPSGKYEFNIWIQKDAKAFEIDNEYYSGGKLLDYLAEQVMDAILKNKDLMEDWGIIGSSLELIRTAEMESDIDAHRKVIDFRLDFRREF